MAQQRLEEVRLSSKGSGVITGEKKRRLARGERFFLFFFFPPERWNSRWPFPRIHLSLLHSVELPGSPAAPPDGVNINVDTADMNYLPDVQVFTRARPKPGLNLNVYVRLRQFPPLDPL